MARALPRPRSVLRAMCLAMACAASAAMAAPGDAPSPIATFFQAYNAQPDSFAQYRFLTSPEVQGDAQARNLATQLLATQLSLLGRPREALRAFPMRAPDAIDETLPTPASHAAIPAVDWITAQAAGYRAVLVNEAHHAAQTRLLTLSLLAPLRRLGYTHLAVEALANDGSDPIPAGYPVHASGIYTREAVFGELLRTARRLGYVLVPYEPADEAAPTQQARETGQARVIADLLAADPRAKVLVHAGYAHINEQATGLPQGARPMAMELAAMSGLPLLTLDQASGRSWEAGDIATRGRVLARRFALQEPGVLIARADNTAWSLQPGVTDASVLLPAVPVDAVRPDWLSLDGLRRDVPVDLAACLDHLPCLAEARYVDESDEAIPADQFLLLAPADAAQPLYLAPGRYRLRLRGGDGKPVAERTLEVPAAPATDKAADAP